VRWGRALFNGRQDHQQHAFEIVDDLSVFQNRMTR
jgi:hypothetical protein